MRSASVVDSVARVSQGHLGANYAAFGVGVAAAAMISLVSGVALADLKSSCVAGSKNDPDAEKNCSCLASKIKPDDMPAATKAMEVMNALEAAGKPTDTPPPEVADGVKIIFEAMAQCIK